MWGVQSSVFSLGLSQGGKPGGKSRVIKGTIEIPIESRGGNSPPLAEISPPAGGERENTGSECSDLRDRKSIDLEPKSVTENQKVCQAFHKTQ